jgi:hypothetical protein
MPDAAAQGDWSELTSGLTSPIAELPAGEAASVSGLSEAGGDPLGAGLLSSAGGGVLSAGGAAASAGGGGVLVPPTVTTTVSLPAGAPAAPLGDLAVVSFEVASFGALPSVPAPPVFD